MAREVGLQWKFMLRYKIIILRAFWSVCKTNPQWTISPKVVINNTDWRREHKNSTLNFRISHKEGRGIFRKSLLRKNNYLWIFKIHALKKIQSMKKITS